MTASMREPAAAVGDPLDAYEATAPVYDVLTAHHDYELWTSMIEPLAREHGLRTAGRMLDVGCGTGKSFLPWHRRGWSVVACDRSPAMLSRAAEKAPSGVRLLEADARALGRIGSFDLVLALDDVVNYLPAADHPALFAGVAANLAPDGLFVFDLNTLQTFRTFFAGTEVTEHEDCVLTWRGLGDPGLEPGGSADAVLDAFVLGADGAWERSRAVHREHHHPLATVERALRDAGLELLTAHGQDEACNVDPVPDELRHSKILVVARLRREPTYVLRETVEAFPSADGSIYFLRGGGVAEHVLPDPSADDRAALELLHEERTAGELCAALPEADVGELLAGLVELGLVRRVTHEPSSLPGEAAGRYDRQLIYFASASGDDRLAEDAQRRLLDATVCIVGCGGLGSWTAAGLACAGVGRLVLVDDDTVELSNLNRQLLFRRDDVGRRKVDAAAAALQAFNPELEVLTVPRRVAGAEDVAAVAAGSDLIVATADSPPYAIARWVNAGALRLGIPHVSAAQFPPFVRVGPLFVPGETGCERCQEVAASRDFPDYDALVEYRERHDRGAATLGPLSGLVGSVLSTDVMHLLSGIAPAATHGRALVIDSRDLSVAADPVPREPGCEACAALQAVSRDP